jgi:hypothetical protein
LCCVGVSRQFASVDPLYVPRIIIIIIIIIIIRHRRSKFNLLWKYTGATRSEQQTKRKWMDDEELSDLGQKSILRDNLWANIVILNCILTFLLDHV